MQPRILVADDESSALEMYRRFFEREGWACDLAADGKLALAKALAHEYDVIVTDLAMPELGGFGLLRQVRHAKPDQPVIVVSGTARVDDVIDSVREGASDILLKPIDYGNLRTAVKRVLLSAHLGRRDAYEVYRFLEREHSVFELPAQELAEMKLTLGIIDRLFRAGLIDRVTSLSLDLAIQEALANSIDHGTLNLDSKWRDEFEPDGSDRYAFMRNQRLQDSQYGKRPIRIETAYQDGRLEISIRDTGPGFMLKEKSGPAIAEAPLRSYGRGLAIISGAMDEVHFASNGSEIKMIKMLKN